MLIGCGFYSRVGVVHKCEIKFGLVWSWCLDAPPLINWKSSSDHDSICLRPYTALVVMVIMTVSKSEDSEEYELELCRNRGADWRHNQHNYIFSGFLKKVGCRI